MPAIPLQLQPIVKSALSALIEGEGSLESRIEAVKAALEKIPSAAKKAQVYKILKPKFARALRLRSAIITSPGNLPTQAAEKLDRKAREKGALFVENRVDETLLAGFRFQLGDDRWDETLLGNLHQFK